MRIQLICLPAVLLFSINMFAQTVEPDSIPIKTLGDVVVRGYEQNRKLLETAGPVSIVAQKQLYSYGNVSLLPAMNAIPGVRMDERSPGSYRLNFRGSSLRSPFGVRNVKVYLDGIPFTDPGNNTYLNQLSLYNVSSIEVWKGPASSLYGAGNGGVLLINSDGQYSNNQLLVRYAKGSYNSNHLNLTAIAGNKAFQSILSYNRQSSDGYRQQSAMRRDVASWSTKIKSSEKQSLSTHVLFGDLFYETPGGLNKSQYLQNPKAARPASGAFAGAIQNHASIHQRMFWSGISHHYKFNENWENTTAVYGAFTQIENPSIRNYEKRIEPNFGGRTTLSFDTRIKKMDLRVVAGGEFQQGYSSINVYRNKEGNSDSLQTDDEVKNHQASVFAQADLSFAQGWILTAGISVNTSSVNFNRLSVVPAFDYTAHYNNEFAPRLSVLKKLDSHVSLYALVSKGFSPPSVAELLPSTSVINTNLQAEKGNSNELGIRSSLLKNRLLIDVNAFSFDLHNAISQRRDQSGADYFINAGKTRQRGVETALNFYIPQSKAHWLTASSVWVSYTYHHFHYRNFKQLETDYSRNRIPGVAPHVVAAGFQMETKHGIYLNTSYYYSDPVALNDANSEYASAYHLLGVKAGYRRSFGKNFNADLFFSGDNLLNQTYSLGNDINAAGGRFYNTAPGVNCLAGISIQFAFSKTNP